MKTEIGIATINYNQDGTVAQAVFKPTIELKAPNELLRSLQTVTAENKITAIAENARAVFATWFQKTNEIELADQQQYQVVTQVLRCENYPGGAVKQCVIKFNFQKIG